jgi:hypothetical protein
MKTLILRWPGTVLVICTSCLVLALISDVSGPALIPGVVTKGALMVSPSRDKGISPA